MVKCFNGGECTPNKCPYYLPTINNCGFAILGINRVEANPFKPVKQQENPSDQDWTPGKYVGFKGTILQAYSPKKGTRADGTEWMLRRVTVDVDGKEVDLALWGDFAEAEVFEGRSIAVDGALVKEPYKGRTQVSTTRRTKVYL